MTALSPEELEAALRDIGAALYHHGHPFHQRLNAGALTKGQVQAWAINRFYYQSRIPLKDAALLARADDRDLRREWRQRLADHDGGGEDPGGIERWLRLTTGLGLDRDYVLSTAGVLPATRFAVDAYVRFVAERSLLEAVASSLTELFSPDAIRQRVSGMLRSYDFVDRQALSYFENRMEQAPRDSGFALAYVQRHARSAEQQALVQDALRFKCAVLWAQLDALYFAYVEPGFVPPGAFRPEP